MYPVKQSTALTIPVFAHDANGDAVTGLTDGSFTKRISKNGGAFAAMTVTLTEMENGWYSMPLSTSHTDTLGVLTVTLTNAGAKQINIQLRVHARLPDDLAHPTTSGRSIDVTATGAVGIDWGNVENPTTVVDLSGTDINLVDTCTTNSDMRGTDNAALASVLGALADAAAAGDPTVSDTVMAYVKQLINTLEGAAGIPVFPAEAAPANNVSLAEIIRAIHADVTGLNGDAMRGTDSAALASVCTEGRLSELDAGNLPTDIANVQADTDNIQTRLPAALVSGKMDCDATAINNSTDGANRLAKATQCNVFCTVGSASTTTSIVTSAMDPAAAATDQFKGKIVTFDANTTTANLRGQSTDITASTAAGVLTVTALTDAPVSGDTFVIT